MWRDTWNVIQSLLVHISHQARPYSCVRGVFESRYTCLPGVQVFGQFKETGPKYPKSYVRTQKNSLKSPAPQFILWSLLLWRSNVKVQLYLFYAGLINTWRTWRIGSFWEKVKENLEKSWRKFEILRKSWRSHGDFLSKLSSGLTLQVSQVSLKKFNILEETSYCSFAK